jgi:hypothetical protein
MATITSMTRTKDFIIIRDIFFSKFLYILHPVKNRIREKMYLCFCHEVPIDYYDTRSKAMVLVLAQEQSHANCS